MDNLKLRDVRILEDCSRDLVADIYDGSIGLYRPTRIILDLIIGNRNGKLEIGGSGFSKSAIEGDSIDENLMYTCKIFNSKRGTTVKSELFLTNWLESHNGQLRVKNNQLRQRYERDLAIADERHPTLEFRFRGTHVDEHGRLTTELWNSEGRLWRPAFLPLNDLLGSDNSHYVWGGQGFADHVLGTPQMDGMVLCCRLADNRGGDHGERRFDLRPHYTVIKGQFVLRDGTSDPQGSWLELPRDGADKEERARWEKETKAKFMRQHYPEIARRAEHAQRKAEKQAEKKIEKKVEKQVDVVNHAQGKRSTW